MAKYNFTHKYYVYYDKKTGQILAATNEKSDNYECGIELPFDDVKNLINGSWPFENYLVGYKRGIDGLTTLGIVVNDDYARVTGIARLFKNNSFDQIVESNKSAECIVEWNSVTQTWSIILDDNFKNVYSNYLLMPKLIFYVTLESDFDFLIRTIGVNFDELLENKKITFPFESGFETKIDKISISTTLVFKNYKLRIVND